MQIYGKKALKSKKKIAKYANYIFNFNSLSCNKLFKLIPLFLKHLIRNMQISTLVIIVIKQIDSCLFLY